MSSRGKKTFVAYGVLAALSSIFLWLGVQVFAKTNTLATPALDTPSLISPSNPSTTNSLNYSVKWSPVTGATRG